MQYLSEYQDSKTEKKTMMNSSLLWVLIEYSLGTLIKEILGSGA